MKRLHKTWLHGMLGAALAVGVGVLFVVVAMWTWFFSDLSFPLAPWHNHNRCDAARCEVNGQVR
jgi:hypothetical protein